MTVLQRPLTPAEVCRRKTSYKSKREARWVAGRTERVLGQGKLFVYRCKACGSYHLGHKRPGNAPITCAGCQVEFIPRVHYTAGGGVDMARYDVWTRCPACQPIKEAIA